MHIHLMTNSVGSGVLELRIFYGPGYRVYFSLEGDSVMLLLFGGTKGTQQQDVQTAFTDIRR